MKITLNLQLSEVISLHTGLSAIAGKVVPARVAYAVAMSRKALDDTVAAFNQATAIPADMHFRCEVRDRTLRALARRHGIEGVDGQYDFPDPEPPDVIAFHEEYRDVSEAMANMRIAKATLLDTETDKTEYSLHGIHLSQLATLELTSEVVGQLSTIIVED
jgi:hypothetical protein